VNAYGNCPAKVNYTATFPLGPGFCEFTNGQPTNQTYCLQKFNPTDGQLACVWEPGQSVLYNGSVTVACFYDYHVMDANFYLSRQLPRLKDFINDKLLNPSSSLDLNTALGIIAGNITSRWFPVLSDYAVSYNGESLGLVTFGFGYFSMVGLDTVTAMQIFDNTPYNPINGTNRITQGAYKGGRRALAAADDEVDEHGRSLDIDAITDFGPGDNAYLSRTGLTISGSPTRFELGFEIYLKLDNFFIPTAANPTGSIIDDLEFKISFLQLAMYFDLFILANIPRLMDLEIRSISSLSYLPCILKIFEPNGLVPVLANITYGDVRFSMCCVSSCDKASPTLITDLQLDTLKCVTTETSSGLSQTFTAQVKSVTDSLMAFIASSNAQEALDARIKTSVQDCEALDAGGIFSIPDAPQLTNVNAAAFMGISGLVVVFVGAIGFAFLVPVHFRRRDDLLKRALLDAHAQGTGGKSREEFELAERRLKSLAFHDAIPLKHRAGAVCVVLLNCIFYATAMFGSVGATVTIAVTLAGDTTQPISIVSFSLATSINDMWNSQVYFLALFIFVASGVWPYGKQILMIFCWVAPPTILSHPKRQRFLEWLDTWGKWSLVDIYVLVLMMVAFHFYINASANSQFGAVVPSSALAVSVVVVPGWGIYGFMLGTFGSLLVNHYMIFWHRRAERADEDLADEILGTLVKDTVTPRIPLMRHRFNIVDNEGRAYHYSVASRIAIPASLALVGLLIIIGSVLPVISFTFQGLVGILLGFVDPGLTNLTVSMTQICTMLMDGASNTPADILGVLFLQICFIAFALILPLLNIIMLCVVWAAPLTLQEQQRFEFIAEILFAWEALGILVISLIAAVFQISEVASFIVDAATGTLCSQLQLYSPLQKLFPTDPSQAQCLNLIASIDTPGIILFASAALLLITEGIAFRMIRAAIRDRDLAMRRHAPVSPGEMKGLEGFFVRQTLEPFGASQVGDGQEAPAAVNPFVYQHQSLANTWRNSNPMSVLTFRRPGDSQQQQHPQGSLASDNPQFSRQYSNPIMQREIVVSTQPPPPSSHGRVANSSSSQTPQSSTVHRYPPQDSARTRVTDIDV